MIKKRIYQSLLMFIGLVGGQIACGMNGFPSGKTEVDTSFQNDYYQHKVMMHETVEVHPWNVVFLGNSITERGMWSEWFPSVPVLNRGIGGDNVWGVYNRLDPVLKGNPAKIFLLIGINDLGRGIPVGMIASRYEQIIKKILRESPGTRLVLQTVIPINEQHVEFEYMKGKTSHIKNLNDHIHNLAKSYDLPLLDLHEHFSNHESQLPDRFTVDGLHLNARGYRSWLKLFRDSEELIKKTDY